MAAIAASGDDNGGDTARLLSVPGSGTIKVFPGELIGHVSNRGEDEPRWLELNLYRVTDGTGRYVLQTVGKSLVYHRLDSFCNRGVPKLVSNFPDEAEPCSKCKPPSLPDILSGLLEAKDLEIVISDPTEEYPARRDLADLIDELDLDADETTDLTFDLEIDQPTAHTCETADEVIEHLRDSKRPAPGGKPSKTAGGFSRPAQRLIDQVRDRDVAIAAASHIVERL